MAFADPQKGKEYRRRHYLANKQKLTEQSKKRYAEIQADPVRRAKLYRQRRAAHFRVKYGITLEQFDELLASQGGCCAICETTSPVAPGWVLDHDHSTGALRGVLCSPCNKGLGCFEDQGHRLHAAERYLQRHRRLRVVGS